MLLNAINHFPYLVLFLIRSILYKGYGEGDRPFYYEKKLVWLLFHKFPFYNESHMNKITNESIILCNYYSPKCWYYYQIMEGIFHHMIVFGYLGYFIGNNIGIKIFEIGILLEIIIMDIPYVLGFILLSLRINNKLGYIVCNLHHFTVLPNIIWLIYWKNNKIQLAV